MTVESGERSMGNPIREDVSVLLERYLSRRRNVWGDVAFLCGARAEEGAAGAVRPGGVDDTAAEALEPDAVHGTGGGRSFPDGAVAERWKGESIRYRTQEHGAEQADLFCESNLEGTVDLSAMDFDDLKNEVSRCEKCPLSRTRTNTVFGSGSREAKLLFIGEAPGREEDLQGLPFVGRAGQLLTKILASVGLSREEVYITNILKCRPPNNRDPNEEEVKACEPYLARQIELLQPVLICALGRVAGQTLLKRNASLAFLRGGIHYYNDTKVVVTYHPAALLRNPNLKKDAWEDIKMIRKLYDEELAELRGE